LYFWTDGYPELGGWTHKFVTFYLTEIGHEIVESKGFVPVTKY
jgi:ABC-type phosphate transport system substrate-binding protein